MTWLKTDDRFPEHRKIRRLTDAAYRLHHTAMCACAKDETDGLVTEADLAATRRSRRRTHCGGHRMTALTARRLSQGVLDFGGEAS